MDICTYKYYLQSEELGIKVWCGSMGIRTTIYQDDGNSECKANMRKTFFPYYYHFSFDKSTLSNGEFVQYYRNTKTWTAKSYARMA